MNNPNIEIFRSFQTEKQYIETIVSKSYDKSYEIQTQQVRWLKHTSFWKCDCGSPW